MAVLTAIGDDWHAQWELIAEAGDQAEDRGGPIGGVRDVSGTSVMCPEQIVRHASGIHNEAVFALQGCFSRPSAALQRLPGCWRCHSIEGGVVKKRLTFVAVVLTSAFATVPVAQASVPNPWKSTVVPNPWKVTAPAPNPWKSFRAAPNPWKDYRAAPNPFKDWAAASGRGKRPNPFLSRGKRPTPLIQIGYRPIR